MADIKISNEQMRQLDEFARAAYGVKNGSGKSGGLGCVLVHDGHVVKADTGWFKNICVKFMKVNDRNASLADEARTSLGRIVLSIKDGNKSIADGELQNLLSKLGLSADGRSVQRKYERKLISRKVVASVLNKLDELSGASRKDSKVASVWEKAPDEAKSLMAGATRITDYNLRLQYAAYQKDDDGNVILNDNGEVLFKMGEYTQESLEQVRLRGTAQDAIALFQEKVSPKIAGGVGGLLPAFTAAQQGDFDEKLKTWMGKTFSAYVEYYLQDRLTLRDKPSGSSPQKVKPKLSALLLDKDFGLKGEGVDADKTVFQILYRSLRTEDPKLEQDVAKRVLGYMVEMMSRLFKKTSTTSLSMDADFVRDLEANVKAQADLAQKLKKGVDVPEEWENEVRQNEDAVSQANGQVGAADQE